MSGEASGIILVPMLAALAVPIIVGGIAIAGTVMAVDGAVKLGGAVYHNHQKKKERELKELENSGLSVQLQESYRNLLEGNRQIAEIYNTQSVRVADSIQAKYREWNHVLQKDDIKAQLKFQRHMKGMRENLVSFEREKAFVLKQDLKKITDEQDRELADRLQKVNEKIQKDISGIIKKMKEADHVGEFYAKEYYQNAEVLLDMLIKNHNGQKFCASEISQIFLLMDKCQELIATAPEAAYAVIWKALELTLLAVNKAENCQNEWLMQYRAALIAAEEVHSIFCQEQDMGYLVDKDYAKTKEEAFAICLKKGISESSIRALTADGYTNGEFGRLKEEFMKLYEMLHLNGGEALGLEDLYEIIDDLNVKYAPNVRQQILDAKLNLNEALLIDKIEEQINDALGGGYHWDGSARSGDEHNGEKHIVFVRDNGSGEKISIVLGNDGWRDDGSGQPVLGTKIDMKVIEDPQISEKKRHQIRSRITKYLNAGIRGSSTTLKCTAGTEGRLSSDLESADLEKVRRKHMNTQKGRIMTNGT